MFDHKHYIPVMRWRQAEIDALRNLFDRDREVITPLIEILPSMGGGFQTIVRDIGRNWGFTPFFVDLVQLEPSLRLSDGTHPFVLLGREAKSLRLPMIPVTALSRDSAYQEAVRAAVDSSKHGACIRINLADLDDPRFPFSLLRLVSSCKLVPKQVDLIVDVAIIDEASISFAELLSGIPDLLKWRTLTVLSGAFPKDLSLLEKNSQHELKRFDWLNWISEIRRGVAKRLPAFGDYTIQHPEFSPPKKGLNPSASIRYTASEHWVIMRGEGLRNEGGPGNDQYPANATLLAERSEFCGEGFSFGDKYVRRVSNDGRKPGTPTTWLCAGINHHITYAARQVSSSADASTGGEPSRGPYLTVQPPPNARISSRVAYGKSVEPRRNP